MKKDLITIIVTTIVGFAIAFFITNLIYPGLSSFSFKTLNTTSGSSVEEPSDEIFNFRAVDPTVEVYVGQCKAYDSNGECIESFSDIDLENDASTNAENDAEDSTEGTGFATDSTVSPDALTPQPGEGSTSGDSD